MIDTLGRDELFDALPYMECDSDEPISKIVWNYNWNKEGAIYISPTGNITVDVSFPHYTRTVHYRRTLITDLYLTFKAIEKPCNWTQGVEEINGRMCLIGACGKIAHTQTLNYGKGNNQYDNMLDALYEGVPKDFMPNPTFVDLVLTEFNDVSTHKEVIGLIQSTINRLQKEAKANA